MTYFRGRNQGRRNTDKNLPVGCNPHLTSLNFRSVLEWKTEGKNCDIELGDGATGWKPLHMPAVCVRDSCSADLSDHIHDIYQQYKARVRCSDGVSVSPWDTSNKMQLYKDVKVGPPLLNMSLQKSQLDIFVNLPLAPWLSPNGTRRPLQSFVSNLGDVTIHLKIGNLSWNTVHATIVEDTGYRNSLAVPYFPGAEYCVSVTPKAQNGITEIKCETALKEETGMPSLTAVFISVVIISFVFTVLIILYCKSLKVTTTRPKVMEFPIHCAPVMTTENLSPEALSLVSIKKNITLITSSPLLSCKGYEQNGFSVSFEQSEEEVEGEEKEDSASSQSDVTCENHNMYPRVPHHWNCSSNVDLHSIQLMGQEVDLLNEVTSEPTEDNLDISNTSVGSNMDSSEREDENWDSVQTFNGYEKRH
ncbi:uncharacterized protein RCH25_043567 [Pelodytes ibericus]